MKTSGDEDYYLHDEEEADHPRPQDDLSRHLLSNIFLGPRESKIPRLRIIPVLLSLILFVITVSGIIGYKFGLRNAGPASIIPKLTYRDVVFEPEKSFAGGLDPEAIAAWDSLMPPGRGFVLIKDSSKLNLDPGIPTDLGIERYSVSVFHQLHCLGLIRLSYFSAKENKDDVILHGGSHLNETSRSHIHGEHIDHCFDFLRQALMCAADTTIESAAIEKNGGRIQVDGWGASHQCKDWNTLWEFMVENQAPTSIAGIA